MKRPDWFVYMLECEGGRLYTGATPDVAARFEKHRAGDGGAFTRSFRPRRILAARRCGTRGQALSAEHALKQLARPEKLAWARRHKLVKLDARLRGHDDATRPARGSRR